MYDNPGGVGDLGAETTDALKTDPLAPNLTGAKEAQDKRQMTELLAERGKDGLTGLENMKSPFVKEEVERVIQNARRSGTQVTAAMLDLDRFKAFNDKFGHAVGDLTLQALAESIKAHVRKTDIPTRDGGEEFTIFFMGTDPKYVAEQLLPKILVSFREHLVKLKESRSDLSELDVNATFSAGVTNAAFPEDRRVSGGDILETLKARGDALLYEAKNSGRNRVVLAQSELMEDKSIQMSDSETRDYAEKYMVGEDGIEPSTPSL